MLDLFFFWGVMFTVLLQENLHLLSSCQAVGFALETSILPGTFPLEHLQHPEKDSESYNANLQP